MLLSLANRHMREFSLWLRNKLNVCQKDGESIKAPVEGRLGPSKITFNADPNSSNNVAKISKDKLTIQSQSAFCTLKANCCVYKGKWMYEVSLYVNDSVRIDFTLKRNIPGSVTVKRRHANRLVLVEMHIYAGHRCW